MQKLDKDSILARLAEHKNELSSFGLARVALFGSYARGEEVVESDIDILLEFVDGAKSYKNFMNSTDKIEEILQQKVDVVTLEALSPYIGPYILKEAEYVQIV